MTFWTRTSKHLFPNRSAKMIDGTEKPKNPSKFAKRTAQYNKFRYKKININLGKWKKLELNNVCMASKTLSFYNLTSNIPLDKAQTKLLIFKKQNYAFIYHTSKMDGNGSNKKNQIKELDISLQRFNLCPSVYYIRDLMIRKMEKKNSRPLKLFCPYTKSPGFLKVGKLDCSWRGGTVSEFRDRW